MKLAEIVAERDENMQDFRNKLNDLQSIREELSSLLEAYDNKIYSLANSADLYPHLYDDLETTKKLLKESYVQPEPLIRSIETLQHLLRKYMGF